MHNPIGRAAGAALISLLAIACGGAPAGSGLPSGIPTLPPVTVPSGSFQIPSFQPDPVIDAAFPAEIDGQPLEDKSSGSFLGFLQAFVTEAEKINAFVAAMQSIGVDPAAVGYGTATATVNDESLNIQIIRFPGGNAGLGLDALVRIDEPDDPPTLTTQSIGGKNATVATDSDGDTEYYYVNGEWAWYLPDADLEQAAVVFAAVP